MAAKNLSWKEIVLLEWTTDVNVNWRVEGDTLIITHEADCNCGCQKKPAKEKIRKKKPAKVSFVHLNAEPFVHQLDAEVIENGTLACLSVFPYRTRKFMDSICFQTET